MSYVIVVALVVAGCLLLLLRESRRVLLAALVMGGVLGFALGQGTAGPAAPEPASSIPAAPFGTP